MSQELILDEVVTKFFLNTCRLYPQITDSIVQAAGRCASVAALRPDDDAEAVFIPLTTGSVAEFYIEPMLPLIGDIDVMYHWSTDMALPQGHPPPIRLPAEFSNYVKVWEIEDSHLPGYVYLNLRYLLTESTDDNNYNCIEYDHRLPLSLSNANDEDNPRNIHGPAVLTEMTHISPLVLSIDYVSCVRCLSWPPQAADWPTRHRNYDWPDSATVDHVVNNGCDVVGAVHPQCKQDEWMSKSQWRLSFSRAEIVLMNSWMPVQQIVYHMLRFFVKMKQLTDSGNKCKASVLSNYHLKTLMLWACELKSSSFWIVDLNLIDICVKLLHILSAWMTDTVCPHYFVQNCNLIHNSFGMEMIFEQLKSIDKVWLASWFLNNYIRASAMLFSDYGPSLFCDINTDAKLLKAVSVLVDWRLNTALKDTWVALRTAECYIANLVSHSGLTVWSCSCWMTALAKTGIYLPVYFTAVVFLYAIYKLSRVGFTDELMDVLATVAGHSSSTCRHPCQCSSELSLSKAMKLMKVLASTSSSCNTVQVIEIELSKAYLYRALKCKDSDSDSTYCLANVYLAVLYCTTGQYQTAIDHCTLVMRSPDHSQCSSRVVQGELLPKIDDDIDSVLGLAVFYQYVRTAALNQRQIQHVSFFTTKLFAHYLNIRCFLVSQKLLVNEVNQLISYISNKQLSITDVLSAKLVISNFHCQSITLHVSQQPVFSATDVNTSELVELLQQSAVEHLTTFRQLEARDFGSVATVVTTDFDALYAYKRGDYQRCLQLSTQNIQPLL